MIHRHMCLIAGIVAIGIAVSPSLQSAQLKAGFDTRELQKTFARAKKFELITSVADIPEDGQRMLNAMTLYHLLSPAPRVLADMGMDWSGGDAKLPNLPWGQHHFSAVSSEFVAIVFATGGTQVDYHLILAPRNQASFCWFRLPTLGPRDLRVSVVQDFVRPDRDQTVAKTLDCNLVSTNEYK